MMLYGSFTGKVSYLELLTTDRISWSPLTSCRAVDDHHLAWTYYAFALVFDIATTGVAMFYVTQFDAKSIL